MIVCFRYGAASAQGFRHQCNFKYHECYRRWAAGSSRTLAVPFEPSQFRFTMQAGVFRYHPESMSFIPSGLLNQGSKTSSSATCQPRTHRFPHSSVAITGHILQYLNPSPLVFVIPLIAANSYTSLDFTSCISSLSHGVIRICTLFKLKSR